jgi:hypothetical protein
MQNLIHGENVNVAELCRSVVISARKRIARNTETKSSRPSGMLRRIYWQVPTFWTAHMSRISGSRTAWPSKRGPICFWNVGNDYQPTNAAQHLRISKTSFTPSRSLKSCKWRDNINFCFNAMNSVHFCSITLRSNQMHYFYYLKLKTLYNISLWYTTNCL